MLLTVLVSSGQTYHRIITLDDEPCGNSTSGVLPIYSANSKSPTLYGVCSVAVIDGVAVDGGIFEVEKSGGAWTEKRLSYFSGSNGYPAAGGGTLLQDASGILYGTAEASYGLWYGGVIYAAYPNGVITPLYDFTTGADGGFPVGGLTADAEGNLYGTAAGGGDILASACPGSGTGCGVVFELVKGATTYGQVVWTYTVLYTFPTDGSASYPLSPVTLDSYGNVYGTTYYGGASAACGSVGCGTVFKLRKPAAGQTQWTASTVYEFTGGSDGASPANGVIFDSSGNLYGGTNAGGTYDAGTIYQLTPSNGGYTEKTLYTMNSIRGQYLPPGSNLLLDASGNLWGTAELGAKDGNGTVFELIANTWKYKEVHKFAGGLDSETPAGSLTLDSKGNIWGTTYGINLSTAGGSIFEITPAK